MVEILDRPFVGVHELRKELTRLIAAVSEEDSEIVITQQGKPVALLISVEKYLELKEAVQELSNPEYLAELLAARREIREGRGVPADKVFAKRVVERAANESVTLRRAGRSRSDESERGRGKVKHADSSCIKWQHRIQDERLQAT